MDILGQFATSFRDQFNDPSFASGFLQGALLSLLVGYTSSRFLFWWNRMLQASRAPAVQNGPSPLDNMLGCAGAGVVMLLVVAAAGYLIFGQ